ncbi:heavy metal translocating P-type ATPase [Natronohydrobacter thiooxidans]|uniref:heavy metal translocating P-type ATPase n=1 Tax=Natronohydrobacter thiooxidans TaxID=87172 RepID=UPI0008FF6C0D|nr:heavy metal translocating P-type ATPase [Natronohydrobacter thiooxidans]
MTTDVNRRSTVATATLTIPGMGSDHCAGIVRTSLERLDGVQDIQTSIAAHRARVRYDAGRLKPVDLRAAVERAGYEVEDAGGAGGPQEVWLTVPGMGSDHCAGIVADSVRRLPGIEKLDTNIGNHRLRVSFDAGQTDAQSIRAAVERAGYEVDALDESRASDHDSDAASEDRYLARAWKRLWIAAIPATLIMVLMGPHMFWQPIPGYLAIVAVLAFPVVFLFGGWATHVSAWRSLTNRTANMDVLISMGSLPPYLIGLVGFIYPMTSFIEMAATIMTFHLIGRYLEARAKGRASQAIKRLIKMGAKTAAVLRDGAEVEVPVAELQPGDIMLVRPGAKVPTDGEIVDGNSHLDESIATGESVPVEKGPGDAVIGATINKEGLLRVRATRVGADTFLSQVIRLVEEAQGSKVPIQEFADRLTGYFVPAVLVIALGTFVTWLSFDDVFRPILHWGAGFLPWVNPEISPLMGATLAMIAVLVIACPCALGLATPTALMVGSGMGAERGVLIRSGEAIQTLKDIKVVVLDKTGTITRGQPALTDVHALDGFDQAQVLRAAASVEAGSEHPLAQAIVAGARERGIDVPEVTQFKALTARGVQGLVDGQVVRVGSRRLLTEVGIAPEALEERLVALETEGKTAMLVAIGERAAGLVAVADTIKEDSKAAIAEMHALGIHVVMVTGDNERTARHVARQVGLDEVMAGVLPEGKVEAIRALQDKHGQHVAMVGDGINDAPALKQANVGIAIGAGADVAIEAADVTLVTGELTRVVEAIRLSKATFRKIVENLFWAWFYNLAAIPVAALGLLHPMIGVIAMTASSLSVIGNSLLLKRAKLEVRK